MFVHFLLPGAAPESDRQMFQEVHHQPRLLARQLGHQVCVPLHGQVCVPLILYSAYKFVYRYMDSFNLVSKAYTRKLQQMR